MKVGFTTLVPDMVRMSSALRCLREQGSEESAQAIEKLHKEVGSLCPKHGELKDPLLFTVDSEKVAFGCPWCSDPELLAAWEKEGAADG